MKITKQQLMDMGACRDGLKRFIKQTNGTDSAVDVATLIGGENTYSDLLWLAGKTLPKERIVLFACDCALTNIELIKPYTDKYELIVAFLNKPDAAYAAAYAYAAAGAAYAYAAGAAYAADAAAAAGAAYAADAAYAAAVDAAVDAAAAAAGSKDKVNALLTAMFNEVE